MAFGHALGTACVTFAITNIDDLFVLVTFFTEASTSRTFTPIKITVGQYVGFTVIMLVSMIGFAVSLALPSEPIGFLGLLPVVLGIWKALEVIIPVPDEDEGPSLEENLPARSRHSWRTWVNSIFKVSSITVMNGGDNISTYIPLFSQAKKAEIAVYVVTYYILLGVWCLAAFLVLRQKYILRVFQKYAKWAIPLLYVGLGIYIIVKSDCYPWSIQRIDASVDSNVGEGALAGATAALLLTLIGCMIWLRMRQKKAHDEAHGNDPEDETAAASSDAVEVHVQPKVADSGQSASAEREHPEGTELELQEMSNAREPSSKDEQPENTQPVSKVHDQNQPAPAQTGQKLDTIEVLGNSDIDHNATALR